MSCWRSYQCSVLQDVKMKFLKEACKEMNIRLDDTIKSIAAYGNQAKVDCGFVLNDNGANLPLGFVFTKKNNKTKITLEGDFWGTGFNEVTFVDELSQRYQKIKITTELERHGYSVSKSVNNKGEIELLACC